MLCVCLCVCVCVLAHSLRDLNGGALGIVLLFSHAAACADRGCVGGAASASAAAAAAGGGGGGVVVVVMRRADIVQVKGEVHVWDTDVQYHLKQDPRLLTKLGPCDGVRRVVRACVRACTRSVAQEECCACRRRRPSSSSSLPYVLPGWCVRVSP